MLTCRLTNRYENYHALKIMAIRDIIQLRQVNHVSDELAVLAAA